MVEKTALAEAEIEYEDYVSDQVWVKFPIIDPQQDDLKGASIVIWTTTPWTLTSNVGAAVNPELTYLKVKLKGEIYYVAKGAFKLNRMESSGGEGEDEAANPEASAKKGKLTTEQVGALAAALGLPVTAEDLVEVTHRLNGLIDALEPLAGLPLETIEPVTDPAQGPAS